MLFKKRTWLQDRTLTILVCIHPGDEVQVLMCRVSGSQSCPLSQPQTDSASDTNASPHHQDQCTVAKLHHQHYVSINQSINQSVYYAQGSTI